MERKSSKRPARIFLTDHAEIRMTGRRIPFDAVELAVAIGRIFHVRGATVYAIGKKELSQIGGRYRGFSRLEGVRVVVCGDGIVKTVVRNRDFRQLGKHGKKAYAGRRGARRRSFFLEAVPCAGSVSHCRAGEWAA